MNKENFSIQRGSARPLGVSERPEGINFALYSSSAKSVTLCLFHLEEETAFAEITLDPKQHRTGQVWHLLVEGLPSRFEYGYRIPPHPLLLDPYAKSVSTRVRWGEKKKAVRGRAITHLPFDWQNSVHPRIPEEKLIIYEMHVRGFTQDPSSGVAHPGTYRGLQEKIPYLVDLGVNAIELMPIHHFEETENLRLNPLTQQSLVNFWGYSPLNFFALMGGYASTSQWGEEIQEFKEMVRAFHQAGIEVYVDVVFNHTGESLKKILSFLGIDEKTYYLHQADGSLLDVTGCGNTLQTNHPIVMDLIMESLRYFVSELHVDGFRFDLASVFCRGPKGAILNHPPILAAIVKDPVLSECKLIAEAWDAAGLYQVGNFPGGDRWMQWNGRYRDVVRRFIKGTDQEAGAFATALCGSEDLFGKSSPLQSLNFITAHDGFTLRDLVSYQNKHNIENGEENQDGANWNDSWNCGREGPTIDPTISALRARQMKNLLFALFVSRGVPMLLMGDEYGHTRGGNNNAYCQDNQKNYFLWNEWRQSKDHFRFVQLLIAWRKKLPVLRKSAFLTNDEVAWHGLRPHTPDWSEASRFVAYQFFDPDGDLYIAFNAHFEPVQLELPKGSWRRVIYTALPSPEDCVEKEEEAEKVTQTLEMTAYSALLLKSSQKNN